VKSITYFSISQVGVANWFHHTATDIPFADISRDQFQTAVEMAGVGYRYTLEEVGHAMMTGIPLTTERAAAAYRAYQEFCERVALVGDASKNWTGLINNANVTATTAPVGHGSAPDTEWIQLNSKTPDDIIADMNFVLSAVYVGSNTVELANTLLLPVAQFNYIATTRLGPNTDISILDWFQKYNVYTAQTGQPVMIRVLRQLKDAGGAGVDRMVAYRRSPDVLKMHFPMPHRFLQVWQTGPLTFDVPGIFRLGPVEVRLPAAMRYLNGI
jgi:hypothetical protein